MNLEAGLVGIDVLLVLLVLPRITTRIPAVLVAIVGVATAPTANSARAGVTSVRFTGFPFGVRTTFL